MTPASVGFHCPECLRTGAQRVIPVGRVEQPVVVVAIIAANVVAFLAAAFVSGDLSGTEAWRNFGANTYAIADGEWWRAITSAFVHDGPFHLGMNMWFIYVMGRALEQQIGHADFAGLYALGITGGSLGVVLLSDPFGLTVGASGAAFALMGALVALAVLRKVNLWDSGLGTILVLNLVITFAFRGTISVGGHLGGLIVGFLGGAVLFGAPRASLPPWTRTAALWAGSVFALGMTVWVAGARVGV